MKRVFALVAVGIALLCGACSQPVSPSAPSSVPAMLREPSAAAGIQGAPALPQAAESVPFRGRLEGSQTVTPLEPPFALVEGEATGNATYLGRFTVEFPHTVNFATAIGVGTYTFTAANGDTLTAMFTGQAQLGTVTSIVEDATITGGTGRFAGATGSFTARRLFDPATGTTTGSLDGTISAPGADNP
jgi:hypothetical protein